MQTKTRVLSPQEKVKNLFSTFKFDFPASIVVFLVALPLCLGIALASDAPLFSGIITGVVAGLVVSLLSGSELSISGPAAGLTVIVAHGIHNMTTFEAFLCALVIAGVIQFLLGVLRCGSLASLFPNCVIEGMLAAIGITIILKQIPYALGGLDDFSSDVSYVNWAERGTLLGKTVALFYSINFSAFIIALISIVLLVLWNQPFIQKNKRLAAVPGPLVAVVFGALLNVFFTFNFQDLALYAHNGHLVALPNITSWDSLINELRHPDFSVWMNSNTWALGATIAAVASIETLLCIESTDKLDPLRRVSHRNRELMAQGTGNIICGLIGGIPMTSVIVRSSANVYAGAKTRLSCLLSGFIMVISVLAMSSILNHIPLASLAAVLIVVGFKLTHPKLIKKVYHSGWNQFIPFAVTVIAILMTDLLKGVFIGFIVGLGFVIGVSYRSALMVVQADNNLLIRFTKDVTFIHKIKLRRVLRDIQPGSYVFIDGTAAQFFDHDILEMIKEFAENAPHKDIKVDIKKVSGKKHN